MYRPDPILSSSPPRVRAASESGDELAPDFVTQPTQLLNDGRSPFFAAPSGTQPTLMLTPRSNRMYDPNPSQVLVERSSPAAYRQASPAMSQSQPRRQNNFLASMAPPGTYSLLPQPVKRPIPIDLTSDDDPPVEPDSEEDDFARGSNIPRSKIETQRDARVEETPQKRSFDLSGFAYNSALPRKRPGESDGYGLSSFAKKARPLPRQTGPSRAIAVSDDPEVRTLEDIPDPGLKNKVIRLGAIFPNYPVKQRYEALLKNRGHFDDASCYLAEMDPDDNEGGFLNTLPGVRLESSPDPIVEKKTAQVTLKAPVTALQDRYAKIAPAANTPSSMASPEQPRKKGRLVRGRRNRSPSPLPTPPRPQQKKPVLPDEDDEAIVIPSDTDSAAGQSEEEDIVDSDSLLEFFNTCSVEAMVDLSGHKENDIRAVFEKRPFNSLAAIEKIHVDSRQLEKGKKARKPKYTFGERLVESAKDMWNAYETIDQVVKQCEVRGRPMVTSMARWGIDIFGASTDGEVAITSLDDGSDTNSTRDSGYQSPRTSHGSDSDGEDLRKVAHRTAGKQKLLKKPAIMNDDIELKDYQIVGLNWLNLLWQNGISGILADDMGLGKTCQVISFISHLKETGAQGPHVIIVPGSTLENWAREFRHFSEQINFVLYYGLQNDRNVMQDDILDQVARGQVDVVITTYDLAFKKDDNKFLRRCQPQTCIYDEGHVLRNSTTLRYQSLMKIPSRCRLLLTGTPLQNSLQELTSILAFLMPDIFNTENVKDSVATVFKHKAKVTESDTHDTLLSTQRINRARSMMTPFVLRRKKAQVLKHLPTKTCRVEYCELTPTQKKLYSEQLQRQRQILLDRAAGLQPKEQTNVMMKLRQAAIHPLLFRERYNDNQILKISKACLKEEMFMNSNPDVIYEELQLYQDYQCHSLAMKYPKALGRFALKHQEWMDSGKVAKLVELLKKFKANGDRTLVFSQFTSVMDILQWVLDDLDIGYFRLDGQTPISTRQMMLDQFYEDESIPVFMLSTKSGGAGINLACANKVIIFDSSFNPQDDIQAENRAHRVGQVREVEVVRLVTKGTVEEQIHSLGVSKLELDKMVAGEEGAEPATKKKGKAGKEEQLSAAEAVGIEAVEKMLMEEMEVGGEKGDVKDQFLVGLKKAGLDLSAA
ncbi:SNF2 family helicase/ATPase-like protein [Lentithecium fluviatile CBS 122367]|uniref:DNA helicase n=1 Tax=Lentithecium fluviatile CBS 122367 TaxID=1168545 RepID=A0A6G1IUA1_9PLEO|nr:SNF2 family helicase/ATPase-like protein [Lentithecium fluviatile CBS 122367]